MPSKQTKNYKLSQWEKSDRVLMDDFNADNAKIDAALKAGADARAALAGQLSGKGNCQLYVTSYDGAGRYGAEYPTSLSFPKKPQAIFIAAPQDYFLFLFQGVTITQSGAFGSGASVIVSWLGNSVSWYSAVNADSQLNQTRKNYFVVALLQAD